MNTDFNPAPWRDLYQTKLKPLLDRHNSPIQLDERNEFYLSLLHERSLLQPGKHLVDLGAGLSVFGPLCRTAGVDVTLVDDFGGGGGVELRPKTEIPLLDAFEKELGMHISRENFLEKPLPIPDATVNVVTCFHSLEHWHNSPKSLFREISRVLKPGGFLLIATPNAVNIRKRIYVILGRTNFPTLNEWYNDGHPVFRGHVREPVIADLHQLMQWNGFRVVGTYGRNFIGRQSQVLSFLPPALLNAIAAGSDFLLRLRPSLCSDIHVMGQKTQ